MSFLLVNGLRNSPSLSLVNTSIIFFGLSLPDFPQGFKTRLLGRGFHTLVRNAFFPTPTDVGTHSLSSVIVYSKPFVLADLKRTTG